MYSPGSNPTLGSAPPTNYSPRVIIRVGVRVRERVRVRYRLQVRLGLGLSSDLLHQIHLGLEPES